MPDQSPPAPVGPPADYFLTPPEAPVQAAPSDAPGFALPPQPAYPPSAYAQPGYVPPPYAAGAGTAGAVGFGFLSQFRGIAGWACVIGLVTVIVPLVFGRVFFFLPIIGIVYGFRATTRGAVVGGVIGIVLSAIGGILTIIGLTAH